MWDRREMRAFLAISWLGIVSCTIITNISTINDANKQLYCCLDQLCNVKSPCDESYSQLDQLYLEDPVLQKMTQLIVSESDAARKMCGIVSYLNASTNLWTNMYGCVTSAIKEACAEIYNKYNRVTSMLLPDTTVICNTCQRNFCNMPTHMSCCTDDSCGNSVKCATVRDVVYNREHTMLHNASCVRFKHEQAMVYGCAEGNPDENPCEVLKKRYWNTSMECMACDSTNCNQIKSGDGLDTKYMDRKCFVDESMENSAPCRAFSNIHKFGNDELLTSNSEIYEGMTANMDRAQCISILYIDKQLHTNVLRGCAPKLLLDKSPCDAILDLGIATFCHTCTEDNCNTMQFPNFHAQINKIQEKTNDEVDLKADLFVPVVSINYKPTTFSNTSIHFCTGVLLKANWVLLAAHCLFTREAKEHLIPMGLLQVSGQSAELNSETSGVRSAVISMIPNPKYVSTSETSMADVALLKLETPMYISFYPTVGVFESGSVVPVYSSGWGSRTLGSPPDRGTLTLNLGYTIPYELCINLVRGYIPEIGSYICVLRAEPNVTVCKGGPIFSPEKEVLGVASLQADCTGDMPILYTKLSWYDSWIREIIGPA